MIGKYAQKRIYDAINRPPVYCFIAVSFATYFLGFITHSVVSNWYAREGGCSNYLLDSYIGKSHEVDIKRYVSFEPIDVVYTWVNGTDPTFLNDLETHLQQTGKGVTRQPECKLDSCFPFAAIAVDGALSTEFIDCLRKDEGLLVEEEDDNIIFVAFPKIRNGTRCLVKGVSDKITSTKPACITSSVIDTPSVAHPLAFYVSLVTRLGTFKDEKSLRELLPSSVGNQITDLRLDINEDFALLFFQTESIREEAEKALREFLAYRAELASILPAFIVDCSELTDNPLRLEARAKRFVDNEELRFSLRSLDQFAPWIRHVYLLTNGQIPNWLNLDNPHLTIVTHEDIFTNKSALPTFSSPAIESQLINIPGIGDKFIYFNDDFFIGQPLYPEDFTTLSTGQKFYVTYALPNCATGCPHTWIHDGYCDRACNNTDCDFDGGDCIFDGSITTPPIPLHPIDIEMALERAYCSNGCSNAWIADGFCDAFCNVQACAFDAGDCGVASLLDPIHGFYVFHLDSTNNKSNTVIEVPDGQYIAIGDLSAIVPDRKSFKIGKCSTPVTPALRTASYVASQSLLVLIAFRNISKSGFTAQCELTFADGFNVQFNITFRTHIPPKSHQASTPEATSTTVKKTTSLRPKIRQLKRASLFDRFSSSQRYFVAKVCARYLPLFRRLLYRFQNGELTNYGLGVSLEGVISLNKTCNNGHFRTVVIEKPDERQQLEVVPISTPVPSSAPTTTTATTTSASTLISKLENGLSGRRRTPGLSRQQQSNSVIMSRFRPRSLNLANSNSSHHQEVLPPDAYSGSLLHVNKLLNRDFGYAQRRIPAHAPLLIQKKVFKELYARYRNDWLATSSRRFRSYEDMQLQFSYMYYVMSATMADSPDSDEAVEQIFNEEVDIDHSGDINLAEMKTLMLRAHLSRDTGASSLQMWRRFGTSMVQHGCFANLTDFSAAFSEGTIDGYENVRQLTLSDAKNCQPLRELFNTIAKHRAKYKFEVLQADEDSAVFKMLQSNVLIVEAWLNTLRRRPPKFFCLNDDMDHSEPVKPETEQILAKLKEYFSETFPLRSQFELPPNMRNRFQTVTELRQFRAAESQRKNLNLVALLIVGAALLILMACRWGQKLWRWCCYNLLFTRHQSTPLCGSISTVD